MSAYVDLFGETLLSKEGEVRTADALANKVVALYFSAHWCPPCRGFTPVLSNAYIKALSDKGLEVVFLSSDRDQSNFELYYAEMPWLAVAYSERAIKNKLSEKYGVSGIPMLIIIDENGNVLNKNARADVHADPEGERFPWKK